VLADTYEGRPFSRPNDLIVASNGGVYFTDPGLTVAAGRGTRDAAGKTARNRGCRRPSTTFHPRRAPIRNRRQDDSPNGIQLSRDGEDAVASDSNGSDIIAWDIRPTASCATGAPSAR